MTVYEILEALNENNSRLYKESVLQTHKENDELKEFFRLCFDPMINFHIRKIPTYTEGPGTMDLKTAMGNLQIFSSREVTGNAAIIALTVILEELSAQDAYCIEKILARDPRCGVQSSTVNKIWPGLIPSYPVMLASQQEQKLIDKLTWPAIVQTKMDGMRANAIVKAGKVEFRSRNGKPLDLLGNLEDEFAAMASESEIDLVIDGELWAADENGNPLPRKTSNGICSKANKGTISPAEAETLRFTAWDIIPYDAVFEKGFDDRPYEERLGYLQTLVENHGKKVHNVESCYVQNFEEAVEAYNRAYGAGEEGVILKDPKAPWENKRSKGQIKMKAELDATLRCIRYELGQGRNANRLGNLVLESEDGIIECSVGTGFDDSERNLPPEHYVDKLIDITYNARIKSKGADKESLFLPVYQGIRTDKDKADYAKDLK